MPGYSAVVVAPTVSTNRATQRPRNAPPTTPVAARAQPAAPWFRPNRRFGGPGVLTIARVLVLEVVIVGVLCAVSPQPWLVIAGAALAVVIAVMLFGRSHGRWWTESAMLWLRYRRRGGTASARGDDPRLAALCDLAPELTVENIPGADDSKLGMGGDGAGWFSVLEVATDGVDGVLPPVPLAELARIASDAEQTGVVMQLVSHNAVAADDRKRTIWVAVRLDAHAVAESALGEGHRKVDVPGVLAEMVRRVERVLRRRGLVARTLTADELLGALVRSADLLPDGGPVTARETWRAWYSRRLAHRCYWLASWPDAERGTGLLAQLADLPAAFVSIAFVLEPTFEGTGMSCLVRVAAVPGSLGLVCDRAEGLARRAGGRLSCLDGQHGPAVYASAPSGGGAR